MDLSTQVSALVGTSALIYVLTKPKPRSHESVVMEFSNPRKLTGAFKYSPDHRKRFLQYQESLISTATDESASITSEESNESRSSY